MTREIRLYVEGGGDQKDTKQRLRTAFGVFLKELRDRARMGRIRWRIVMCGGRENTFDLYKMAVRSHPDAFNILLVDAEGPVDAGSPWQHLKASDRWDNPGVENKHCHLMVQMMEAWLIADREKLKEYYGDGFHDNAIPKNPDVEGIAKNTLATAMDRATRDTKKGTYHKTRHAPEILQTIRPDEVRQRASYCRRLFDTVRNEMDAG